MLHPGEIVLVRKIYVHAWDKLTDKWEKVPHEDSRSLSMRRLLMSPVIPHAVINRAADHEKGGLYR